MKIDRLFRALSVLIVLSSCSSKGLKDTAVQPWREMDALGITMEKAFRPLKDSSAVGAATRMMAQLADEAEKLSLSTLPEKMNREEVKTKLNKLKVDTRTLAHEIATGTEEEVIGTDFYKIHDLFLEIKDAWEK
jgi:L-amino acid N-acyltransferase YncA